MDWLRARDGWVRVLAVALYATGMGYAETAAVVYIRLLHGGVDPIARTTTPPPIPLLAAEVGREAATIAMLLAVAALAGRGWAGRWGAFILAFGLWDITYYLFFALLTGWPASPLAWDVLFLIPLPWWGPVLAPMLIAAAMTVSGAALLLREAGGSVPRLHWPAAAVGLGGALLCLYVFMADAIGALGGGEQALRTLRPTEFNWPLFLFGYLGLVIGFLWTALAPSRLPSAAPRAGAALARPDSAAGIG